MFTIHVSGQDEVLNLLDGLGEKSIGAAAQVLLRWGNELTIIAQAESPKDPLRAVDRRRRGRPRFADQWESDARRETPTKARLVVGNIDPRLPFVIGPTSPREIPRGGAEAQRAKGYMMRFYWQDGPAGAGFYQAWQIHGGVAGGGTEENPVHERALGRFGVDGQLSDMADFILTKL